MRWRPTSTSRCRRCTAGCTRPTSTTAIKDGLTSAEQAEIVQLRRETRRLEMENEILRRAAAYFAREHLPKMTYPLVRELAEDGIPVTVTCGVLEFSTQGYYKWRARPDLRPGPFRRPSGERHRRHPHRRPGVRLPLHLRRARSGRRGHRRAPGPPAVPRAPDLVHHHEEGPARLGEDPGPGRPRRPRAARLQRRRPDAIWLTDITEHPTGEGKLYCCSFKDLFSNRIVGYAIGPRMTAELATSALRSGHRPAPAERGRWWFTRTGAANFAPGASGLCSRRPSSPGRWAEWPLPATTPRWSRSTRCCRRTSSTARRWTTRDELHFEIVTWIEHTYNRRRRQRALGRLTPVEFELAFAERGTVAA